jgi:hypothetical protein
VASILSANYGTDQLQFTAAGILAATRCMAVVQDVVATGQLYSGLYTIFNISTPSCGEINRAHAADFNRVYDVYSCLVGPTIVTGVIMTNPSTEMLVEAMECSTTLSDALGSGVYMKSANEVTLNPGQTFESTPMTPTGLLSVFEIANAGWIQAMSDGGSQGLLTAFINQTPLNDTTMTSKMQDSISYLYAVGGAKIVNNANAATTLRGASTTYLSCNTTSEIDSQMFQIGYGRKGTRKWFIVFLALNAFLTLVTAICMIWYPPIPVDPTEPPSMLLGLNNSQAGLLSGTSAGRLPDTPWRERVKGWFMAKCGGTRRAMVRAEKRMAYENLKFQLEAGNNVHPQLPPYGNRGGPINEWMEPYPPTMGKSY